MTTSDDETGFQVALDANPDDHTTRLVLADYLDEIGDVRGPGYRALALLRLQPHGTYYVGWTRCNNPHITGVAATGPEKGKPVHWGTDPKLREKYSRAGLPLDWFDVLNVHGSYGWVDAFRSRREAENAAAVAFSKLPPDRQRELLQGGA